ncbi:MAG: precorrin-4 C(11)-methyltransferase [Clostridiales bacterium]|jgi:precorrin-4/cobalt-precorrin-4 C11-methyltransferase|nr:precorrin-4 C(11)-methyltransferase [Clostridiales bacterium]
MVYFVGAGPGAPDLITLRGKNLLENADVIIYAGSLVNPALLGFAKANCEVYNSAVMTLDEVIEVIKSAENSLKTVIRLHTGDPSLYGAVREQMDRLTAVNIEFEVCPGVSSFCAAAASLKAEYTLPGISQTVILTRAAGRTPVPDGESIRLLAAHKASMVLFLSANLLEKTSEDLISGGYPGETPAAIVYKASWQDEKIVPTTVAELAKSAAENNINKTALVCVGNFLGENYNLSKLYSADFATLYREAKL